MDTAVIDRVDVKATDVPAPIAYCVDCRLDLTLKRIRYGLYVYDCPRCGQEHRRGYRGVDA